MGDSAASARPSITSDPQDVYREFRQPLLVLALTTGIAGFVDAFAFLRYGAFVANQSGNAVLLGIGLAGRHGAWPESAASLIAFATGTGVVSHGTRGTEPVVAVPPRARLRRGHAGALGGAQRPAPPRPAGRAVADRAGRRRWLRHGRAGDPVRSCGRDHHRHHLPVGHGGEDRRTRRALARPGRTPAGSGPGRGTFLGLLALICYATGGGIGTVAQEQPQWVPAWGALALSTLSFLVRSRRSRR